MRHEVSDGNLCCIAAMAAGRHEFIGHLVSVGDEGLHGIGDLVVEDVLVWGDAGFAEVRYERRICV